LCLGSMNFSGPEKFPRLAGICNAINTLNDL
jgi:hypothetical protein